MSETEKNAARVPQRAAALLTTFNLKLEPPTISASRFACGLIDLRIRFLHARAAWRCVAIPVISTHHLTHPACGDSLPAIACWIIEIGVSQSAHASARWPVRRRAPESAYHQGLMLDMLIFQHLHRQRGGAQPDEAVARRQSNSRSRICSRYCKPQPATMAV